MKDVDLNLLPSLQALLELRNVSRAAERMHLSQPAMSAALGRLRRHFNDELLVRAGRGYELTPFAQALAPRVERALTDVQDAMQLRSEFDPASSDRRFVLAASDYVTGVLIRHLRALIAVEAPGVSVDYVPTSRASIRPGLESFGSVDLIVGPMGFDLQGNTRRCSATSSSPSWTGPTRCSRRTPSRSTTSPRRPRRWGSSAGASSHRRCSCSGAAGRRR